MDANSPQKDSQTVKEVVKKKPSNKMAKFILFIMILLLLAIIGGLTYLLINKDTDVNNQQADTAFQEQSSDKIVSNESSELIEYVSEEFDYSFTYPKEWGKVETTDNDQEAGKIMSGRFSDQASVTFSVATREIELFGRDGGCDFGASLGVIDDRSIDEYRVNETNSSMTLQDEKESQYRTVSGVVFESANTVINERFEAGRVEGIGACLGYSSDAVVLFDDEDTSRGVRFFYSTPLNKASDIDPSTADDYVENSEYYFDATVRDDYIALVKSTRALR